MQTIVHAPLPVRSMSQDGYYFAQGKETGRTVVAYLTEVYKTSVYSGRIVLIFNSSVGPNEIVWLPEDAFYDNYTVIGRVNKMIFE
jgi:hypothetical protein